MDTDENGYDIKRETDLAKLQSPWLQTFDELRNAMIKLSEWNIFKRIIIPGRGDEIAGRHVRLVCHYNMFIQNELEAFDSSYLRGSPHKFANNDETVMPGMLIAIRTMRKGEEAQFVIGSELMFGALGCAPRIPPNSDILLLVQIIECIEIGNENAIEELTPDERRKFSFVENKSNELFTRAKYEMESKRYSKAAQVLHSSINALECTNLVNEDEEKRQRNLLTTFYTKLCECYIEMSNWQRTCSMFNELHRLDNAKNNWKALLYNGMALQKLGEYDRSLVSLKSAQKLKPNDSLINKHLQICAEKKEKYDNEMRNMWRRSFNFVQKDAKPMPTKQNAITERMKYLIEQFCKSEKMTLPLEDLTKDDIKTFDDILAGNVLCKLSIRDGHNSGEKIYEIVKSVTDKQSK